MKKFFVVMSVLISSHITLMAQADAISKYFDKYLEDERFTVVYISPKSFQMLSKMDFKDPDSKDVKQILQDLRGIRILTTELNGKEFYKEAINSFNTTEYELLMTVRSKGENVRFWTKESDGIISELLMLVGGESHFVMMSIIGKIDLQKISALGNQSNIKGMEYLKEVKKN